MAEKAALSLVLVWNCTDFVVSFAGVACHHSHYIGLEDIFAVVAAAAAVPATACSGMLQEQAGCTGEYYV